MIPIVWLAWFESECVYDESVAKFFFSAAEDLDFRVALSERTSKGVSYDFYRLRYCIRVGRIC